jgi:hypothetical protein
MLTVHFANIQHITRYFALAPDRFRKSTRCVAQCSIQGPPAPSQQAGASASHIIEAGELS